MTTFTSKSYQDHVFTLDELEYWMDHPAQFSLPEHFEVVEGRIVETMPTQKPHGRVGMRVIRLLDRYVEANELGEVLSLEVGFRLQLDPLLIRCPDVAFVSKERQVEDQDEDGFYNLAPNLAVEIVSPDNSGPDMAHKAQEYLSHGTELVWIVNPKRKEVKIYRPDETQPQTLTGEDEITGENVIVGFSCKVSEFFG